MRIRHQPSPQQHRQLCARPFAFCFFPVAMLAMAALRAQSPSHFFPGAPIPGVDGAVYASTVWDPDGIGPLTPLLVLGGDFTLSGGGAANKLAAFDPTTFTWTTFGTAAAAGTVRALAVLPTGELVAARDATVVRWNGTGWVQLGSAFSDWVRSLVVLPSGELAAAGHFTFAGSSVARWTGSAWSALGALTSDVVSLTVRPNGELIAGGGAMSVPSIGPTVFRWDGTSWSPLGATPQGFQGVQVVAAMPNGDVIAAAWNLGSPFGTADVHRWNGTAWAQIAAFTPLALMPDQPRVLALLPLPNGDLLAGGHFVNAGAVSCFGLARWNGTSWSSFGGGIIGTVHTLAAVPGGQIVAAGALTIAGTLVAARPVSNVALWTGSDWFTPGTALQHPQALHVLANGELVAGGSFVNSGTTALYHVARWTGTAWAPLGSGMTAPFPNVPARVVAFAEQPNGHLIAAGAFGAAGGVPANGIARWDGVAWHALGTGLASAAALAVLGNGDLVAASPSPPAGVARWDGSTWSTIGGFSGVSGEVKALLVTRSGDLFAAGTFSSTGTVTAANIARWNGTAWSPLGPGLSNGSAATVVNALAELPDGSVIAAGRFSTAGGPAANIARWDGAVWSPLGAGTDGEVRALLVLPDGDLLAGGAFTMPAACLARWDGSTWSTVDGGVGPTGTRVDAMALKPDGEVVCGGTFLHAGAAVSAFIARLQPGVRAAALPVGAGCPSSGGGNVLAARTLPWAGSRFVSRATGLPPLALVASVVGLARTSLSLAGALPFGQPGCALLVRPDAVFLDAQAGGTFEFALELPDVPALAGLELLHQLVVLEIDAQLQFVATTATNPLALRIGWL